MNPSQIDYFERRIDVSQPKQSKVLKIMKNNISNEILKSWYVSEEEDIYTILASPMFSSEDKTNVIGMKLVVISENAGHLMEVGIIYDKLSDVKYKNAILSITHTIHKITNIMVEMV